MGWGSFLSKVVVAKTVTMNLVAKKAKISEADLVLALSFTVARGRITLASIFFVIVNVILFFIFIVFVIVIVLIAVIL